MSQGRILVVDDNESVVDLLIDMLSQENVEAMGTTNSRQALELIEEFKPNALFIDLEMPDINGLDLLKIIRESHPLRQHLD